LILATAEMHQGISVKLLLTVFLVLLFAFCAVAEDAVQEKPIVEPDGPQQLRLSLTHEPSTEMMITWLSPNLHGFVEYYPYSYGSATPAQGYIIFTLIIPSR
jgi:hypothetical protein